MPRVDFTTQRLFVEARLYENARVELSRDQANYLVNVLRMSAGASLLTFNGTDGEWRAHLELVSKKTAALAVESRARAQEEGPDVDYLFAPIKHARLDYMAQKAVEMGARRLRPVLTRRTQTSRVNLERLRANAIEAAEQCGILTLAKVEPEIKLESLLAAWPHDRLLIFCDELKDVGDPIALLRQAGAGYAKFAVLIGPEGGFDEGERHVLRRLEPSVSLSLGPRIMRADTAAVAALALFQAALGDCAAAPA